VLSGKLKITRISCTVQVTWNQQAPLTQFKIKFLNAKDKKIAKLTFQTFGTHLPTKNLTQMERNNVDYNQASTSKFLVKLRVKLLRLEIKHKS